MQRTHGCQHLQNAEDTHCCYTPNPPLCHAALIVVYSGRGIWAEMRRSAFFNGKRGLQGEAMWPARSEFAVSSCRSTCRQRLSHNESTVPFAAGSLTASPFCALIEGKTKDAWPYGKVSVPYSGSWAQLATFCSCDPIEYFPYEVSSRSGGNL